MLCSLSKILLGFLKSLLTFSNVSDRCSAPVRRRWALISATEQAAETYCLIRTYANPFVTADRGTQTERAAVKTPRSDPAELNLGPAVVFLYLSSSNLGHGDVCDGGTNPSRTVSGSGSFRMLGWGARKLPFHRAGHGEPPALICPPCFDLPPGTQTLEQMLPPALVVPRGLSARGRCWRLFTTGPALKWPE